MTQAGETKAENCMVMGKEAAEKKMAPRKRSAKWEHVLAVIDDPKVRSVALSHLQTLQIKGSEMTVSREAKEAVADALTRTEDWLELEHPRSQDRERIKRVRRRIEVELWP